jgi:hypothetical protein
VSVSSARLAFPILYYGPADGGGAPAELFSVLLPVLRHPLHPRRGSVLLVVLRDSVYVDPSRGGRAALREGKLSEHD